jgi:M6 family metalloprotease-like protein
MNRLLALTALSALAAVVPACSSRTDAPAETTGQTTDPLIDPSRLIELRSFWNPAVGDNAMSTNPAFAPSGYGFYRSEGMVFRPDLPQPPGTLPLNTWYSAPLGDYFTTTNPHWNGTPGTVREGYTHIRTEGYVFDRAVANTAPLELWYSSSRGDNFTTADPVWLRSPSPRSGFDYLRVRPEGFLLPNANSAAAAESFHYGTMGGGLTGAHDLVVLALSYADQPLRHTPAQIEDLFFTGTRNVAGYTSDMSYGRYQWRRAGVIPIQFADDPDTTQSENNWAVQWDPANVDFLFTGFRVASGKYIAAAGGGGSTVGTSSPNYPLVAETFGLVDLNGGHLVSGDVVAFKTSHGQFLNQVGGQLAATATSSGLTAARFQITKSGGGQILPNDTVTLRSLATSNLVRETSTGVDVGATSATAATQLKIEKTGFDDDRAVSAMVRAAAAAHFSFADFDRNGDGVVDRSELSFFLYGAQRNMSDGAGTRYAGAVQLSSSLQIAGGAYSSAGEDVSLSSATHELSHQLGTIDLYGAAGLNFEATLMSATIYGQPDVRRAYHLDPWHKMRLGWVRPFVAAITDAGGSRVIRGPTVGGGAITDDRRPTLLFDPARYDVAARTGEFFIVEWRERAGVAGTPYDQDVPDTGIYVWQCKTDASGNPLIIPHTGGGIDASVNLFGAPSGVRGGTQAWKAADGTITLRYIDGTDAGIRLRVGPSSFEWSRTGSLPGRIDSIPATVVVGGGVTVDGAFPVPNAAARVELVRRSTGVATTLPTTSWTTSRILVTVPTSLATGLYDMVIVTGSVRGNSMPITLQ